MRHFGLREVNPALCCMLGYSADELIGRSLLDLVHPDERDIIADTAAAADGRRGAADPARTALHPQIRRTALGQRQCRTDPRSGRPVAL